MTIVSFGCRLNIWESEVIARHSESAQLDDTIIINSCAVTAEAEKQARQAVRKHRRDNPEARIVVTGCAAQLRPDAWGAMDEVDAVIGNHEKLDLATWQNLARRNSPETLIEVGDIMAVKEEAPHLLEGFDNHTRAFLQIQQGCDHRCTFCIIPYGRGNNRSLKPQVIIEQIRTLADNGTAEVVLTGVDIASWGGDLEGAPKLGSLVKQILEQVPQLRRLRLSSLDPAEADKDLLRAIAEEERLMPHLHLSIQHGDNLILKRMKRRHSRDDVIRLCEKIRSNRPDVVFGSDIIAGFPTETEEAHQASLDLIKEADITWLHVFPFSAREGTPAARMPQLESSLIKEHASALRQLGEQQQQAFLESRLGCQDEVLMETGGVGHSRQFARMRLKESDDIIAGAIYPVRIVACENTTLIGERC